MKRIIIIFLFFPLSAQAKTGFNLKNNIPISIPFQFINNIILIQAMVNGVTLTFMLDSGVGDTLMFSVDNENLNLNNTEKITFNGLGEGNNVEGLKSSRNIFWLHDNFTDTAHSIYIILNEDFNISEHLGVPVNGVIGYDFFKNYPVSIDFVSHRITIYPNTESVKYISNYNTLPIALDNKKPYVNIPIRIHNHTTDAKMLLDIGNSDALWIFPNRIKNFHYQSKTIDDYLGRGFSGDIRGRRGRIHSISLGEYVLQKPIVSMPDEASVQSISSAKDRVGSLGTEIISRFNVIIDYPHQTFYFKKNKYFNYAFKYNMSGLDIKNDGMEWSKTLVKMEVRNNGSKAVNEETDKGTKVISDPDQFQYKFELTPAYVVIGVRKDSPGDIAEIKESDKIISIKNISVGKLTLQDIHQQLSSKEDKTIHIVVQRGEQVLSKYITLKDPIPYTDE